MRHPCPKKTRDAEKPPKNRWLINRSGPCVCALLWLACISSGIAHPTNRWLSLQEEPDQTQRIKQQTGQSTDMDSQIIGPTYPIIEEDFISVLHQRFNQYQAKHPEGLKTTWLSRLKQTLATVKPKQRLPRATQYRFWYQNPTIVLKKDVRDDHNTIIAARGTVINPLIATPLNETLLFFDADDKAQIEFVARTLTRNKHNDSRYKLIVVQGNLSAAHIKLKQRVYADQHGDLTQHFHLQRLPTLVQQVGLRLKLEEFPMNITK